MSGSLIFRPSVWFPSFCYFPCPILILWILFYRISFCYVPFLFFKTKFLLGRDRNGVNSEGKEDGQEPRVREEG